MTTERRQVPRYPCHLRASLMIDGQLFEAMCTDIGPGGAYLATSVMATPGTRLGVALASPSATSMIAASAEVMYTVHRSASRRTGVAVRWMEMTPSLNRAILTVEAGAGGGKVRERTAAQADTEPLPAAQVSEAATSGTAKYQASLPAQTDLPITQRTRKASETR